MEGEIRDFFIQTIAIILVELYVYIYQVKVSSSSMLNLYMEIDEWGLTCFRLGYCGMKEGL